jgi:hypothetical protein
MSGIGEKKCNGYYVKIEEYEMVSRKKMVVGVIGQIWYPVIT